MASIESLVDGIPYKVEPKDGRSIQVRCNCMGLVMLITFSPDGIAISEKSLRKNAAGKLAHDVESNIRKVGSGFEITQVGHYTDYDGAIPGVNYTDERKNIQEFEQLNRTLLRSIRDAIKAVNSVAEEMPLSRPQQELLRGLNASYQKHEAARA